MDDAARTNGVSQPKNAAAHGPRVTMGRIVRWVPPKPDPDTPVREYPAIITTVHTRNVVNLSVFDEGETIVPRTSVEFDAQGIHGPGGTWHWPPRD